MSIAARESNTPRVEWDEAKPVVDEIFKVWVSGSGLLLARQAWETLATAGLTLYETDLERSEAVVRLLAFGAYYREFCVYAFDEGSVGEWCEWITSDLIGERPLLGRAILGEPETRSEVTANDFALDDTEISEVLQQIVRSECRNVVSVLKGRWGDARFFASLYATAKLEIERYPLSEEEIGQVVSYDISGTKQRAWEWVDSDGSLY